MNVVVDTTEQAEFDFASWKIPARLQELIGYNLKVVPSSPRDRSEGVIRIREFQNWEIGFVIFPEDNELVILIMGIEPKGELEGSLEVLIRAGKKELPEFMQAVLEGRKKKS